MDKGLVITYLPFKYYVLFIIVAIVIILFILPALFVQTIKYTYTPKEIGCPSDFRNGLINLIKASAQNKNSWNVSTLGYMGLSVEIPYEFYGFKKPLPETPFFFLCHFGENIGENKNYLYCESNSISFFKEIVNVDKEGNILNKTTIIATPSALILNQNLTIVSFNLNCKETTS
jgi:hypothetical protein